MLLNNLEKLIEKAIVALVVKRPCFLLLWVIIFFLDIHL